MKADEIDGSPSTVDSEDENFEQVSKFEASLEILLGTESNADASVIQDKIIDTIKHTIDENVVGMDIIQTFSDTPNEEETNGEAQEDGDIEEMEDTFQNAIHNFAEELNKVAQVIKEEKDQIEKELQSYKDIREMFDKICKDYDGNVLLKPKSLTSHQDITKQCRQAENIRHVMPTASMHSSAECSMSLKNPWFYSKCLQDAEKFCDQQMERVRRCISVSSINSHAVDVGPYYPTRCPGEPLLDKHQEVIGEGTERQVNSIHKWNHIACPRRQQPLETKHLDKRLVMERGDGGDEDTHYGMWPVTSSAISNQVNCTGDPCVRH